MDTGSRLKLVRESYKLSQRELARRSGVTNATISLIEQNRVSPSVSSLKKLLEGIPMSLADFFTFDQPPPRTPIRLPRQRTTRPRPPRPAPAPDRRLGPKPPDALAARTIRTGREFRGRADCSRGRRGVWVGDPWHRGVDGGWAGERVECGGWVLFSDDAAA